MHRVFTTKSHHSNFYLESRMLVNNTGVTEGILEDSLFYDQLFEGAVLD